MKWLNRTAQGFRTLSDHALLIGQILRVSKLLTPTSGRGRLQREAIANQLPQLLLFMRP